MRFGFQRRQDHPETRDHIAPTASRTVE